MAGNSMGACNVLLVLHLLHFKFELAEGSNPSPASKAREMNAISFFLNVTAGKRPAGPADPHRGRLLPGSNPGGLQNVFLITNYNPT